MLPEEELDGVESPTPELPDSLPVFPPVPPAPEREPFWDYVDLLLLIGLGFASLILIELGLSGWMHFHPKLKEDPMALAMPIQFVAYALVYLCLFVVFKFRYDRPVFRSLGWKRATVSLVAAGIGGVLLSFGIDIVASQLHTPKELPFDELTKTPLAMVLLGFTAVVLGPVFEELVFRGFLQPLFSRSLGVAAGVFLTALLFGALHGPEYQWAWQYVAAITIVGIALGTLRAKTDSIIPSTVMHGCFNSVSVVAMVAQKYFIHK